MKRKTHKRCPECGSIIYTKIKNPKECYWCSFPNNGLYENSEEED